MSVADIIATVSEELYGAPLDEFTARRDGLVRSLRVAGDKEAADAVKKLAKPSVAAWTVNQLARERADDLTELIEAGADVRRVQEWLLRREADPRDLRGAVEAERAVVGRLAAAAGELLQAAGRAGGPSLLERVAETLHAAASDAELGERVRAGTLVREEVAVGVGVTGLRLPPSLRGPEEVDPGEKKSETAERERRAAEEAEAEAERRGAIKRAEVRARTAAEHEREAQRAVGRAQGALVSAEQELTRAQHTVADARERLAEAEGSAGAARTEAEAAAAELDELRGDGRAG